jgi:hypothetical protein
VEMRSLNCASIILYLLLASPGGLDSSSWYDGMQASYCASQCLETFIERQGPRSQSGNKLHHLCRLNVMRFDSRDFEKTTK